MEALEVSEFYGFARLGLCPEDVSVSEKELQHKYASSRVPEFICGSTMVEIKRIKLDANFNIKNIVRKACEKANLTIVMNEKVSIFFICYVIPLSTDALMIRTLQKMVKSYTAEFVSCIHVKKMNIVFTKAPDFCFSF